MENIVIIDMSYAPGNNKHAPYPQGIARPLTCTFIPVLNADNLVVKYPLKAPSLRVEHKHDVTKKSDPNRIMTTGICLLKNIDSPIIIL
jgi:hypothetical protein